MEDAHVVVLLEEIRGQFKVFGEALQATNDKIDRLAGEMNERFDRVDVRLTNVEGRLTDVDVRLTSVDTRLTNVEGRLTSMAHALTGGPRMQRKK